MTETLENARSLAATLSEAEFIGRISSPVFLLDRPATAPSKSTGFRTGVLDPATLSPGRGETQLFALSRADGKQTLSIAIGRTSTCDVQLDSPAVSKLHAMVQLSATKTGYIITDNDSSNGTWVNDSKLAPNQPQTLKSGDSIDFGHAFKGKFYEPSGLYQVLRQTP